MSIGITQFSYCLLRTANKHPLQSICDTFWYPRIRSNCRAFSYSLSNFGFKTQTILNRSSALLVTKSNLQIIKTPIRNKFSIMAPVLQPSQLVKKYIDSNRVMIFSKSTCPYCCSAKQYFVNAGIPYEVLELDNTEDGDKIQQALQELSGQRTVPNIYINGVHVGGADALFALDRAGKIRGLLNEKSRNFQDNFPLKNQNKDAQSTSESANEESSTYDYDLVVIGGGSGGLATSKEAAKYGKKVAVFDFIVPTPIGTTWGLGGTCVNVGCIPKKLMHQAALLNEFASDSVKYGWQYPDPKDSINTNSTEKDDFKTVPQRFDEPARVHSWTKLVGAIQDYLGSLNFKYRTQLREKSIKYYNAYARFIDPHTIEGKQKNGKTVKVTSKNFLIATGLRPQYLDIPGAKEYCITSDDIFSLDHPPGKTLCVGASYISLETAGFLQGLGFPTTVMVRSILLRGFDQQMAELVGKYMAKHGVTFIRPAIPTKIEKIEDGKPGRYMVHYKMDDGSTHSEEFNTILLAIGRVAKTEHLGIKELGVKMNPKNNKLITHNEQSSVPHIYGVGDNIDGKPELTPVAIEAGTLLAKRLYARSSLQCDYDSVPTTVFTPLEYGACGLSEEEARARYGDQDIEVYHTGFKPLEWTIPGREDNACYGKLVVVKSKNEKVVGIHYLGPNAGEVIQGYAVAIKVGVTKADFDRTIGIHPTQSEIFTTLAVTKSSGEAVEQAGC